MRDKHPSLSRKYTVNLTPRFLSKDWRCTLSDALVRVEQIEQLIAQQRRAYIQAVVVETVDSREHLSGTRKSGPEPSTEGFG